MVLSGVAQLDNDAPLIDKRLLQLVLVLAKLFDLPRDHVLNLVAVTLSLAPYVEDDLAIEPHVTGIRLKLEQEFLELLLHCLFGFPSAALPTMVIGVIAVPAF
ncbi:MAG: hypothetical protein JWN42_1430 [Candidatus Angelobacter sp.]|nr:hypothetical protein [Candidatus Angelobacter sp.]